MYGRDCLVLNAGGFLSFVERLSATLAIPCLPLWIPISQCLFDCTGYLSEAGASLVDEELGLNIVPKTKVVKLISPSFHYSRLDRARARAVQSATERFPETVSPCQLTWT